MALDVELYRRTVYVPVGGTLKEIRRISVIDIHPEGTTRYLLPGQGTLVFFFGQKISFAELDLVSNRFAHALRSLGVQVGDRVAIVLPNVPQCVIAFYGTLKAGSIVVLGSPLSNEEEIAYQLRDSEARVLLTLASYRSMAERMCTNTSIQHIIYTDVREYLPMSQRVMLASLIEGSEPHRAAVTPSQENLVQDEHPEVSL